MRLAVALILFAGPLWAEAPDLRTPSPVIYLADNLDEADRLGWCIDTQGRGFGENLHAHSCKPQGGDVQFSYDAEASEIRSVAFPVYCMTYQGNPGADFGLVTCDADATEQRFVFDADNQAISPASDPTSCVVVGAASRSAGPFLSRDLNLAPCADTAPEFRTWVVAN